MGGSGAEVERVREALSHFIELSGLSRREVATRLLQEGFGTDLGRLLSGRLDLKVRHVLAICRVIGLYPHELFRLAFKEPEHQRSPLLQRLDAVTGTGRASGVARVSEIRTPAADLDELNRRLSEILRRLDALTPTPSPARTR